MELAFLVYLIETVLPNINILLGSTMVAVAFGLLAALLMYVLESEYVRKSMSYDLKTLKKITIRVLFPIALLFAILPSKQSTYFIVGAYFTQEVMTSEFASSVLSNSNETVTLFIERMNLELKKDIDNLKNPNNETQDEIEE